VSNPAPLKSMAELALVDTRKGVATIMDILDELRWRGTTPEFAQVAEKIGNASLLKRVRQLEKRIHV